MNTYKHNIDRQGTDFKEPTKVGTPGSNFFACRCKQLPSIMFGALLLWLFPNASCLAEISNVDLRDTQLKLAQLHGDQGEILDISAAFVRLILEHPPNIKDVSFMTYGGPSLVGAKNNNLTYSSTNYYRAGWAPNAYFISMGPSASVTFDLTYTGFVEGKFGPTNWLASGGGVTFTDGKTTSPEYLGQPQTPTARQVLSFGVLPLLVGSVHFNNEKVFMAANFLNGQTNLIGRLITSDGETVSGIEYEVAGPEFAGWVYIASFLKTAKSGDSDEIDGSGAVAGITCPFRRWVTYALGPNHETNFIQGGKVWNVMLTTNAIKESDFYPSRLLSSSAPLPPPQSYVISNQVFVKIANNNLIALGEVKPLHVIDAHYNRRPYVMAFIILTTMPFLLLLFRAVKSSKLKNTD